MNGDILLDENFDLAIVDGDFVIGDADEQIQQLILMATQGSFRQSPLTGVGIVNYLKKQFTPALVDKLKQKIQMQLQYDGFSSATVVINSFEDIEITVTD
jgi:hypothetical protein